MLAALNTYKLLLPAALSAGPASMRQSNCAAKITSPPDMIAGAELHANPVVVSLGAKATPATGLEGKIYIYHCIAVGLIRGAAGERAIPGRGGARLRKSPPCAPMHSEDRCRGSPRNNPISPSA